MFKYFRILLGIYLTYHFIDLIPYADELFGNKMPYDPSLGPTYNSFPNVFSMMDPILVLVILSVASFLFTAGIYHQVCSLIMWYGWACILNRNVLLYNPGIPYVGWALLACSLIQPKAKKIPKEIFWYAWFLMGVGYTISGLHKLDCPSWIDGTALIHILNGPLARDNFIRDLMMSLPPIFLKLATWFSLGLEIAFLPLGMFQYTRMWLWLAYMAFHVGILTMINFTDLTIGVMIIHLFTFESKWLDKLRSN